MRNRPPYAASAAEADAARRRAAKKRSTPAV
jgi:hypothetical protein